MTKFRLVFGGLIAYVLLGLYIYGIVYAALAVRCLEHTGCQEYQSSLPDGIVFLLTTVGGLVSALVIAELAGTQPGQVPGALLGTPTPSRWVSVVIIIYMLGWLICGTYSLVDGYLLHKDLVPILTTAGKSWVGVAVAATYSYFGIRQ